MPLPESPALDDLAPGDVRARGVDLCQFNCHRIRAIEHPAFERAYAALWAEFGAKDEMEQRDTLAARFRLAPRMVYEMVLLEQAGEIAAVRDHTTIPSEDGSVAIVHLSHNLVAPSFRRSGVAGWMRAFPVCLAREVAPGAAITLVAEMEYLQASDPSRLLRLQAYEKAGFLKIDPRVVHYHQPDFRPPEVIDATGGPQPPAFQLLVRRVGREGEGEIYGAEVRQIVQALYRMYGAQFRPQDMAHPALSLETYPLPEARLRLLPPTQ